MKYIDDLQDSIAAFGTWHTGFQNTGIMLKTASTQTNTAKPSRDTALNNAITASKTANENTRKDTDQETEKEYKNDENAAWNELAGGIILIDGQFFNNVAEAEAYFKEMEELASLEYDQTIIPAWNAYQEEVNYQTWKWHNFLNYHGEANKCTDGCHIGSGLNPAAAFEVVLGRENREETAAILHGLVEKKVEFSEWAASKTESPLVVGIVSFGANIDKTLADGIVEAVFVPDRVIESTIDDFGKTIQVRQDHGMPVAAARQLGLLRYAETYYGYDIITYEEIDPLLGIAEGSGRFGGTTLTVLGGGASARTFIRRVTPHSPATQIIKHADDVTGRTITEQFVIADKIPVQSAETLKKLKENAKPLTKIQKEVLAELTEPGAQMIVPKKYISMNDLVNLTNNTRDEFALLTRKGERMIIRGKGSSVSMPATQLAKDGWRWSGHTHPSGRLTPSGCDLSVLKKFYQQTGQEQSGIWSSEWWLGSQPFDFQGPSIKIEYK